MYHNKTIAVVVPAYNPGPVLDRVVTTVPDFVDLIVVIDDESLPKLNIGGLANLVVVRHERNMGVGGAILTGYRTAREHGIDIAVVMAGDGQMDPDDLPALIDPVVNGNAVYMKGDRLSHPDCPGSMPRTRRWGNYGLTFVTRVLYVMPRLMDSQCGYTALRLDVLDALPINWLYTRYGFPNDFLAAIAAGGFDWGQAVVRPIYSGEPSGVKPHVALLLYPFILFRAAWVMAMVAVGRDRKGRGLGSSE